MTNEYARRLGMVHVYTGDGKGKTTCALGLAFRALGWGFRACFIQFIKGYPEIGEIKFGSELGNRFQIRQYALDTTRQIDESKVLQRKAQAEEAFEYAWKTVNSGEWDLVVLDEILVAVRYNLIGEKELLKLISEKPPQVELILTGRNASPAVVEAADYVTEMTLVKHPFTRGIQARKGIDY